MLNPVNHVVLLLSIAELLLFIFSRHLAFRAFESVFFFGFPWTISYFPQ